jgi:hypothetical protein
MPSAAITTIAVIKRRLPRRTRLSPLLVPHQATFARVTTRRSRSS